MTDATRTPLRQRRVRPVACGIELRRPEDVPGGVLPPAVQHRLTVTIREQNAARGRARVAAQNYWIGATDD